MKNLIAYYSREGNNYVGGDIVDLPVGNTEVVATIIQQVAGGDIFRIETVKKYPADYMETTKVARQELHQNARPELTDHVDEMADYDVIYLGYPNWWGTMPMAVFSFLEEYDFSGKTIIPFCTHEGSQLGRSVDDIRRLEPRASVREGLAVRGGNVTRARDDVTKWLAKLGYT